MKRVLLSSLIALAVITSSANPVGAQDADVPPDGEEQQVEEDRPWWIGIAERLRIDRFAPDGFEPDSFDADAFDPEEFVESVVSEFERRLQDERSRLFRLRCVVPRLCG